LSHEISHRKIIQLYVTGFKTNISVQKVIIARSVELDLKDDNSKFNLSLDYKEKLAVSW
jgi:hypothetical protein